MTPREFIGRCLDAAHKTLCPDRLPLSTSSLMVAGLALHALPVPLYFELRGYDFTIELNDMHEMMQITAVMTENISQNTWEATMVLSKINNEIIQHWLCLAPSDCCVDLVLFKIMTNNHFDQYKAIQ